MLYREIMFATKLFVRVMLAAIQSRTFVFSSAKDIKIIIYKTIILPVLLYECETWSWNIG
jgi:hypothetical protein